MRYLVTFFWAFIIGQVVCYIGGALSAGSYNFGVSTIISLVIALIVSLIGTFALPKKSDASSNHS